MNNKITLNLAAGELGTKLIWYKTLIHGRSIYSYTENLSKGTPWLTANNYYNIALICFTDYLTPNSLDANFITENLRTYTAPLTRNYTMT